MDAPTIYDFAPYRVLPAQRLLVRDGAPVKLGARAFDVLLALIERRDRTVGKNELMDLVWTNVVVEQNNLEVQIVALRKLLGYAAIATVPGRGYRLTLPVEQTGPVPVDTSGGAPHPRPVQKQGRSSPPAFSSTLFGRDQELLQLSSLVQVHRVVTLAGPTGIGKTRLALAVTEAKVASCDEVLWVDLAPMTDATLIPNALAVALGLNLGGAKDTFEAVLAALAERSPLVVLDNAEHLLDGVASFVTALKRDIPGAHFLVTSQEPLRVDDEQVFRPEPLSLPTSDEPERIAASSAVALFVARAQAVDRRFGLCENRTIVADICRRLDGIPLAIELAAARVSTLGVEVLRNKLDQRFHILTTGRRSSLRRHQTLLAALEWSYKLLAVPEQTVFGRLSVFAGGFTLDAAQQVAEDEQGLDRWDVLEHLGALVEKSLVVAEGEDVPRYRMLETTRLFSMERLIESGESALVRGRHRDHYLALAEDCQGSLLFGDTQRHLARLDGERDNLLLALAWANSPDDAVPGLRLAAALHDYWFMRAMPARGAEVARVALDRAGAEAPSPERCRALVTAGWMSMWAGAHAQATRSLAEALELARGLSEPRLLCLALTRSAHLHFQHAEQEAAAKLASEAVAVGRLQGDSVELGYALMQWAHMQAQSEDWQAAERLYLEALGLRERMHNPSGTMAVHLSLARLFTTNESLPAAKAHLELALALLPAADSRFEALCMIGQAAQWAAATGHFEAAVLLSHAESRLFTQAGFKFDEHWRGQAHIERARRRLSSDLLQHLANAGRALTYEQALQRVRTLLSSR